MTPTISQSPHAGAVARKAAGLFFAAAPDLPEGARMSLGLIGPPGSGKTTQVVAWARSQGKLLIQIRVAQCDPADVASLPGVILVGEGAGFNFRRLTPEWVTLAQAHLKAHGPGSVVIFLDEIFDSSAPHMRAVSEILEGRGVAGRDLDGAIVVTAGNAPGPDNPLGVAFPPASANRVCHVSVPPMSSLEWALGDGQDWQGDGVPRISTVKLPKGWRRTPDAIRARAMFRAWATARAVPLTTPTDDLAASGPWPSSRTMAGAGWLLAACACAGEPLDGPVALALVGGCIGHQWAGDLATFLGAADLPDPEVILADPKSWNPDPGRLDRTWATVGAVAAAAMSGPGPGAKVKDPVARVRAGLDLLYSAALKGAADVSCAAGAALLVTAAKTTEGTNSTRLAAWSAANGNALTDPKAGLGSFAAMVRAIVGE